VVIDEAAPQVIRLPQFRVIAAATARAARKISAYRNSSSAAM